MTRPRILITGGAGFIGSYIADRFLQDGWAVRVLDRLDPQVHGAARSKPEYLDPRVELIQADICDRAAVLVALQDVDVLSHHAGVVGVGQSMYEIERYARTNALGCAVILDVVANEKHKLRKMLVASSMSIYGEGLYECPDHGKMSPCGRSDAQLKAHDWEHHCRICHKVLRPVPTGEDKRLAPSSVYAIQKRDNEEMFLVVGRAYGIPTVAFRYFNVYGTRQALSNPYTGVAAIFISRLLNHRPPLIFEDGLQMREFVSVRDVAEVNWLAAGHDALDGDVFNVGSGKPTTILEIAAILSDALGIHIAPEIMEKGRLGDVRHCFADLSKLTSRLNWSPKSTIANDAGELAEWVSSQTAVDMGDAARQALESRGLAV
jgi:dTDP-L-rhamnose 4-epimerase